MKVWIILYQMQGLEWIIHECHSDVVHAYMKLEEYNQKANRIERFKIEEHPLFLG